ncbi:SPFH domain-containing protein [bacterium]|nr:SPFH domain-containing protein [bacterium]
MARHAKKGVTMQSIQDRSAPSISGFMMLGIGIALLFFTGVAMPILSAIGMVVGFFILTGFTVIQPNTAAVITFFGDYKGTLKDSGFRFTIPFSNKRKVPLKLINFITDRLKVNDLNGNPIEIGAVVVWRVADAAQAVFNVDDYRAFVTNQSDIAIRTIAAHYPYDSDKEMSLRGNIDEIAGKLKEALQAKLGMAGIIIEETKLSHLAYAPEVAAAMLKRQQAVAVFQARQYMVENTLAIIDEVIDHFQTKSNVKISDDKKADLINSLLVTMTSDKESHPVINLGK